MDFDHIMIRLGVDGSAVAAGLRGISGLVSGWAAGIGHHLKGALGGLLGITAIERGLHSIWERIITIKRAASESGFSTNFIQSAFLKLGQEGESYEKIVKPLAQLTAIAGEKGKTATQFLGDIAEKYKALNTQEERNAYLKTLGIKNWQTLIPLLEHGREGIAKMDEGNFFTKISPETIKASSDIKKGSMSAWAIIQATLANLWAATSKLTLVGLLGSLGGGGLTNSLLSKFGTNKAKREGEPNTQINRSDWEKMADDQGVTNAEKLLELKDKELKVREEIARLNDKIGDRDKLTVGQLADRARKIMGDTMPRGLNAVYSITPAMMSALSIQNLEDQAQKAQAFGNGSLADRLQAQADSMREGNPALKSGERWPVKEVTQNIEHIQQDLAVITTKLNRIPLPP